MSEARLREEICEAARRLWDRDLIGGLEGNLSARLAPDRLLCTPSGVSKGHLAPDDLLMIDRAGTVLEGTGAPSSEIRLHLRIYDVREDCQAVVHAHPIVATAFSIAGIPFRSDLIPEAAFVLGDVATAPFAVPGTEAVPDAIEDLLHGRKTFLLSHHGAVTLGRDPLDAWQRMETLERVARMLEAAMSLGAVKELPTADAEVIRGWMSGDL